VLPSREFGDRRCGQHTTVVSLLAESDAGTLEFEPDMIEILGMEGEAVRVEAAAVRRFPVLAFVWAPSTVPKPVCRCGDCQEQAAMVDRRAVGQLAAWALTGAG
jgi:hypothetical protein